MSKLIVGFVAVVLAGCASSVSPANCTEQSDVNAVCPGSQYAFDCENASFQSEFVGLHCSQPSSSSTTWCCSQGN